MFINFVAVSYAVPDGENNADVVRLKNLLIGRSMLWRLNHYRLVFLSFSDSTRGSLLHFSFARPSSRCKRCHAIMHREFTFLEYWKKQFMYSLESPMHHCFLIGALTGVGAMPINVPYEHFKVKA